MVRLLIASGRLKAVNLGKRMTRISLQELTDFAQGQGCNVVLPSSSLPFNNDKRERNKKNANELRRADHEVHDIADGRYDGRIQKFQQGMSR